VTTAGHAASPACPSAGKTQKFVVVRSSSGESRYIHVRNFEIASVGSLLLTDKLIEKEMNELGFVDYESCIFADQESLAEKISWICDEKTVKMSTKSGVLEWSWLRRDTLLGIVPCNSMM
jgi:hypothetical protein